MQMMPVNARVQWSPTESHNCIPSTQGSTLACSVPSCFELLLSFPGASTCNSAPPIQPPGLVVRALVHMHTSQKYPHSVTQGLSLVKQMRNQTAFCLTADVLFLSVIAPACLLCTASNFHRRVWSQTWQCLLGESALLPAAGQLLSSRTCWADLHRGRAARSSPSEGAATIIRTTAVCIRPHLLQRPSDQFQNLACQQC